MVLNTYKLVRKDISKLFITDIYLKDISKSISDITFISKVMSSDTPYNRIDWYSYPEFNSNILIKQAFESVVPFYSGYYIIDDLTYLEFVVEYIRLSYPNNLFELSQHNSTFII